MNKAETRCFIEAAEFLKQVKNDISCIAALFRKYNVKKKDYRADKNLQELISPLTPQNEEITNYFMATNAVREKFSNTRMTAMANKFVTSALDKLYFNPDYNLPA